MQIKFGYTGYLLLTSYLLQKVKITYWIYVPFSKKNLVCTTRLVSRFCDAAVRWRKTKRPAVRVSAVPVVEQNLAFWWIKAAILVLQKGRNIAMVSTGGKVCLFVCLFVYQSIVALHCCVSFCCAAKWISHIYTYIPSSLDFLPI